MSFELQVIQRRMLDAMLDKSLIEETLGLVAKYAETEVVQLISGGEESYILESHFYGIDPAFSALEADYWSINPRFSAIPSMGELRAVRDHEFLTQEEIDRSPAFQEFLRPAGVGNFAGLMLRNKPNSVVGVALAQSDALGRVSDLQARKLEQVGRVIEPLLRVASKISLTQADAALAASGPQPAAVVRRDRVVMRANAAFDELLSAGVLRLDRRGRLDLRSSKANNDFRVAVSAPMMTADSRFVVKRSGRGGPYICSLYPLPVEDVMLRRGEVVLLQLEAPLQPLRLDVRIASEVFGLTRAEGAVADLLFQGLDPNAIAHKRGTSISTVRTIIKSVMGKAECHRQAELVSKLTNFARRDGPMSFSDNN